LLNRKTLLLAAVVFVTALSMRLYRLGYQTLECEELYTIPAATGHQYVYLSQEADTGPNQVRFAMADYRQLLTPERDLGLGSVTAVLRRNVHLPAYFYFMHYWLEGFGTSEYALRFPAAMFGALAALALFFLATELFNLFSGLAAGLLMALSPEQIHFSQQARMYSLLALLAICSTLALIRLRKHQASWWLYLLYGVASIGGLYTHYEYAFWLAAQCVFVWVISRMGRQNARRWIVVYAAIATAFLPWVLVTVSQKANSPEVIAWVNGPLSGNQILIEVVTKLVRLVSVQELPMGWLSIMGAVSLIVYGIVRIRSERSVLILLALWVIAPVAGIIVMDKLLGTRAITISRYWLIAGPPLYLLMSAGLGKIEKQAVKIALSSVLIGFMFAAALLTARGELRGKPDRHQEMALYVDSQISSSREQIVIAEGPNSIPLALAYYGERDFEVLRSKWIADQLKQHSFADVIGDRREALLLVSGQSQVARLLNENGFRLERQPVLFGHVNVARYVKTMPAPPLTR
jgi:uncharacterized membrane protein